MKGFPWLKWYPGDYLRDTRILTLAAKGAWVDILMSLDHAATPGSMTLSVEAWARILGATTDETATVLRELGGAGVANVIPVSNGHVTVECRRMLREENERAKTRQRVARHRERTSHEPDETSEFRLSNDDCNGRESYLKRGRDQRSEIRDQNKPSPNPSGSEEQRPPTEGSRFVDWFVKLLVETGAPDPKLTPSIRDSWADCYDKLLRLDGRTKDEVKEVCRWARNDSFWRGNFMSPMKLRDKKDGVKYFDVFLNKMRNPVTPTNGNGSHGMMAPRIKGADIYTEPADWRDRFARKYPDHTPPESWEKCSSTIRNAILAP